MNAAVDLVSLNASVRKFVGTPHQALIAMGDEAEHGAADGHAATSAMGHTAFSRLARM